MPKRFSVTVTDWQADALEQLARLREVSIGVVIRDSLRAQLPRTLAIAKYLENPGADRDQLLAMMESIDRAELELGFTAWEPGWDAAGVATGDFAAPPPHPLDTPEPPSSNTGAQSEDESRS